MNKIEQKLQKSQPNKQIIKFLPIAEQLVSDHCFTAITHLLKKQKNIKGMLLSSQQ
ncbi:unnamed protein product [Paramecium sonneborni]|uniref:Uncharacterized protein n=1 Tax=Paramecium sonneborni TaxID=65129 RepID=A0A8S1RTQ6_9CILI|nr:unnamed protein product [Paramecium sonneborni]CAD8130820.1 unnamed protein product [Paramecium sonneborni]